MKRIPYIIVVLMLFTVASCSVYLKGKMPMDYTDLHYKVEKRIKDNSKLDKSLCDGQLMLLHIGRVCPNDTLSVYMNDKLVLNQITISYPYPYIDTEEYGGHGEHYYDFLLLKKNNCNILLLMNLRDPEKKVLARVSAKDSLRIKVGDETGRVKSISIPQAVDHFLEIQFIKTSHVDTLQGVRLFD